MPSVRLQEAELAIVKLHVLNVCMPGRKKHELLAFGAYGSRWLISRGILHDSFRLLVLYVTVTPCEWKTARATMRLFLPLHDAFLPLRGIIETNGLSLIEDIREGAASDQTAHELSSSNTCDIRV